MATSDPAAGFVEACRACGSPRLVEVLSLGETPVANALLADPSEARDVYPLRVGFCEDCALVQLLFVLPAEAIFDDDYPYFSSFSEALMRHARTYATEMIDRRTLGPGSLVIELASNDGYLLQNFVERGIPVIGIDPSPGPAAKAEAIGVPTLVEFFGADLARRIVAERGHADLVTANNVMAHVPDLNDFVEGIAILLGDDGVATIENPAVGNLIQQCEFDTVYHEHYCYFSTIAVDRLMRSHGLSVNHIDHFPELHGGTARWHVGKSVAPDQTVAEALAAEHAMGLGAVGAFASFADRVLSLQAELVRLLAELKREGRSIAAYGAAAKGATLLNSSGIGCDLVDFVVDRNVHKQKMFMPGSLLPILDPAELVRRRPDFVLLLAWNFRDEIVAQQSAYTDLGGRFITPVPWPEIL